jgi:hypothetical protein
VIEDAARRMHEVNDYLVANPDAVIYGVVAVGVLALVRGYFWIRRNL